MSEWQPIETAPKNKAVIIYAIGRVGEACFVDYPDLKGWYFAADIDAMSGFPSHWMPLPEPPK